MSVFFEKQMSLSSRGCVSERGENWVRESPPRYQVSCLMYRAPECVNISDFSDIFLFSPFLNIPPHCFFFCLSPPSLATQVRPRARCALLQEVSVWGGPGDKGPEAPLAKARPGRGG